MHPLRMTLALGMLGAGVALSGCVAAVAGAGATGVVNSAQDRGFEQSVNDNEISFEFNRRLLSAKSAIYSGVSTEVTSGRLLLTGQVPTPEDKILVSRVAWAVPGVKEVINNVRVGKPLSLGQQTTDTAISTKLRTRIMADSNISSINYSIDVENRVVYLMGIAQSQQEINRVMAHARDIDGVKNVISYVTIKGTPATVPTE